MERQAHGFSFEQYAREKYNVELNKGYIDKWDGLYKNEPISIKTEKIGSDVEMADIFRNMDVNTNFYLLVGFWADEKNNIVNEHLLYINGDEYSILFNKEMRSKFRDLLDNITNNRSDDVKWKEEITALKKEWKNSTPNLIRPRFKRDHKSQKRIQCAINNKDFYNYFIPKYEVNKDERRD